MACQVQITISNISQRQTTKESEFNVIGELAREEAALLFGECTMGQQTYAMARGAETQVAAL